MVINMAEAPSILLERLGSGVVVITLNRSKQRNAINQAMASALAKAFRDLEEDSEVTSVVLTGSGSTFSAGIDLTAPLNALKEASDDPESVLTNPVRFVSRPRCSFLLPAPFKSDLIAKLSIIMDQGNGGFLKANHRSDQWCSRNWWL